MSQKKPTTTGTKVSILLILLFILWMIANRDNFGQYRQANTLPAVTKRVAANQLPSPPSTEQSKWVEPKIYPGVKLYYSHDGVQMKYIGTIFDAVSRSIDGETCFGIIMAGGNKEYKHRAILWNGHWFMDRAQGQKAIDEFMEK